jgi:hypothetical protein
MMTIAYPARPTADEHIPYHSRYIDLMPDGDLVAMLAQQTEETAALLASFSPAQAQHRSAPSEWNAVEIVGHLADTERVFGYRALRIARADLTPMEGVEDFPSYVPAGGFARRPLGDVAAEFAAVRHASLAFFRSLDVTAWARVGTVEGTPISVRAIGYLVAGHELHHLPDLRRYRDMVA